jgi:hypothetical protein
MISARGSKNGFPRSQIITQERVRVNPLCQTGFFSGRCVFNTCECFNAFASHGSCHSQSPSTCIQNVVPRQEDPGAHFSQFFDNSPAGIFPSATFNDPVSPFQDLDIEGSTQNLDFGNLIVPTTADSPETIVLPDSSTFLSEHFAIDQAMQEFCESEADTQLRADGTGFIPITSSSSFPPPSTSSQSSMIHCAWPSCEKVFETRSDYKYVHSHPFLLVPAPG